MGISQQISFERPDAGAGAPVLDQHFIGGRLVKSHGREVIDIYNPANGVLIGRATLTIHAEEINNDILKFIRE